MSAGSWVPFCPSIPVSPAPHPLPVSHTRSLLSPHLASSASPFFLPSSSLSSCSACPFHYSAVCVHLCLCPPAPRPGSPSSLTLFFFLKFIDFRERDIDLLFPYVCSHWLILACVLTRGRARNLGVSERCSNQPSYLARASSLTFCSPLSICLSPTWGPGSLSLALPPAQPFLSSCHRPAHAVWVAQENNWIGQGCVPFSLTPWAPELEGTSLPAGVIEGLGEALSPPVRGVEAAYGSRGASAGGTACPVGLPKPVLPLPSDK